MEISRWSSLVAVVLASGAVACAGPQLISTPNLYLDSEVNPYVDVPSEYRNNHVDVLYVTDRRRVDGEEEDTISYDYRRSDSMAFGSAVIRYGENVTWDELVNASRSRKRDVPLPLELVKVEELGRFPATPWPYDLEHDASDGKIRYDPKAVAEHERVSKLLLDDMRSRLAKTPKKEAFVFVHGYNNTFEDAVSVIGEIWHFLPRQGVPIAYTWPAGRGGLRGYFYDRESGEYTIFHLKEFLRILSSLEELDKIHLIAHSRGTDVLLTALREILIELGGGDWIPPEDRKLGNVIVAAPDLDVEVISQRISAEEIAAKIDRLTVYMSKTDEAIGFSTWLFVSQKRMGRVSEEDVPEILEHRSKSKVSKGTALIDANVDSGFIGHSYFYSHPAVLSDLILILRDNRAPGDENGRPLIRRSGGFWALEEGYPYRKPEE